MFVEYHEYRQNWLLRQYVPKIVGLPVPDLERAVAAKRVRTAFRLWKCGSPMTSHRVYSVEDCKRELTALGLSPPVPVVPEPKVRAPRAPRPPRIRAPIAAVCAGLTGREVFDQIVGQLAVGLRERLPAQTATVYVLLKGGTVVYVGQSTSVFARIQQHADKDYDTFNFWSVPLEHMDAVESELILKYRPKYNKSVRLNFG